ncbi:MAG TPA: DUF2341 domain-containing protein [Myxococcota bacterium]|nr:DUF2341 domain-containing protein [Myxococcota bacterium]
MMAAVAVISAAACQRDHVDLNRPCVTDGDCVDGTVCNSGRCGDLPDPTCTPAGEICDGRDNDCDGNPDDGFECLLGSSLGCGDGTSRLCKGDCTLSGCVQSWFHGAWPHRIPITLNGGLITSNRGDVVVPLRVPASTFGSAGTAITTADGRDVRITDLANRQLEHQVETWDAARGYIVWVLLTDLQAGESRRLLLYVGNTLAEPASTSDIWDDDYVGIWHLGEEAEMEPLRDATEGERHADRASVSPSGGVFGSGQHYNGSQGAFASKAGIAANSDFTVEGWFIPSLPAQPYRRSLTVNVPGADMQALWNMPNDLEFRAHTDTYTRLRVVEAEEQRAYAVLRTDHAWELWVRSPEAGPRVFTFVYGQSGISDDSDPPSTFHFWANDSSWAQFTPQSSATTTGSLTVDAGRLGVQLPFDLRGGYFVQTYARPEPDTVELDNSGGLPHISSAMQPGSNLPTATSGVWVVRTPGLSGGAMRTSEGVTPGFDQGSDLALPFLTNDIGIGLHDNEASVFVDQTLSRVTPCAWAQPLNHLLLGAYDQTSPIFRTIYIATFIRRWQGTTPVAAESRERAGGVGLGDFAIGVQPNAIYATTNAVSDFVFASSGPLAPRHVAMVVQGTTATIYVGGDFAFSLTAASHGELSGLSLADAFAVNGVVDEVRLSRVARSQAQLAFQVTSARSDFVSLGAPETLE